MSIKITRRKEQGTIKIEDDLTIFQMADYHKQLSEKCEAIKTAKLELVGDVELDTSGIQLLLSLQKQLQQAGGDLTVVWNSEAIDGVFDFYNLKQQFNSEQEKK